LHGACLALKDLTNVVRSSATDEERRQWSDWQIAILCGCGHRSVAKIRRQLEQIPVGGKQTTFDSTRKGADVRVRRLPKRASVPIISAEPSTLGEEGADSIFSSACQGGKSI